MVVGALRWKVFRGLSVLLQWGSLSFRLVGVHVDAAQTMRMLSLKVVCFSAELFVFVLLLDTADSVAIRLLKGHNMLVAPQNI